jgi:hypothetical protein
MPWKLGEGSALRQGMARKFYGIPSFSWTHENGGRLLENFCRHRELVDQYLQCTASIKFAAGKVWYTKRRAAC